MLYTRLSWRAMMFAAGVLVLIGAGCVRSARNEDIPVTGQPPSWTSEPQTLPAPTPSSDDKQQAIFGTPVAMAVGESVVFEDGLKVELKIINDSRCPKGVQCVWAGELSPVLDVSGGDLATPDTVHLGEMSGLQKRVGIYDIKIGEVSEQRLSLTITK